MRSFAQKLKRKYWNGERKEAKEEMEKEVSELESPPSWWMEIKAVKKLQERTEA